jgi:hypothetical protein
MGRRLTTPVNKDDDKTDYGTREIARQFTVVPKLTRGLYGYNSRVVDETEIDRLLLRGIINSAQHSTLEGLMRRLHRMNFVGIKSPSLDSPVYADPAIVGDKRAQAVRGMVKIFLRLDEKMGADKRRALVNLVLMDAIWPGDDASLLDSITYLEDAIAGR